MTKCICVWYWFIFLPYVCPFFEILCWTIIWWLCKQNITWLRQSLRKRKAERVLSDTVGYYHRSKLCCLGICLFLKILYWIIYWWLCKQNITWLRQSVHKRKAETVQLDIVGYYPRLKLPFCGIQQTKTPPNYC